MPTAPGTFGTLAGIPVFLVLAMLPIWGYVVGTILITLLAIPVASRAEAIYGDHDNGKIVIDEVAGYLVTMIGVGPSLTGIALGFILFRFFDILKPWPVRTIDRRVPGGAGVMFDDVAAGIMALFVIHILFILWPGLPGRIWY